MMPLLLFLGGFVLTFWRWSQGNVAASFETMLLGGLIAGSIAGGGWIVAGDICRWSCRKK